MDLPEAVTGGGEHAGSMVSGGHRGPDGGFKGEIRDLGRGRGGGKELGPIEENTDSSMHAILKFS